MVNANGIPLDTAAIVSTALEGVLYGLSLLLFIGTIWALLYRKVHCGVNIKRMITVACLLLSFSTAHMVIDIIRLYEGLVLYRDSPAYTTGPIGFFSDVSQWSFVYKNMIYMLQTLLGDGVVIHRCFVVWQSWWIVVFPLLLWASVAVTGIGCVYFDSQATVNKENIFAPSTGPWIIAFLAATLFTNFYSTSLLAFRIWKVGRRVRRASAYTSVLKPVVRIVLDSGVLYSLSLLAALLCFVAKNRGHYVLIDMITPIIAITFYMVIIRITISKSSSQLTGGHPSSSIKSGGGGALTLSRMSRPAATGEHAFRMEVHITQLTETNEPGDASYGSGELDGDVKVDVEPEDKGASGELCVSRCDLL